MSNKSTEIEANVGGTKPEFLSKDPTSSPSPQRMERKFEDEQVHSKVERAVHDMHNSSVSELLRMAEIQMIESEMEKKHKCELLYHMTRQKLEMCQLRKELDTISDLKDYSPVSTSKHDSNKSTHQSSVFKESHFNRGDKIGEIAGYRGSDNMLNSIIGGGITTKDWEALRMTGKIPDLPGSPELGPNKGPCGNHAGRGKYPEKENTRDLLQHYDYYDTRRTKENFLHGFGGKSRKYDIGISPEESTLSKFNAELYKTEICRSWSEFGLCPYSHNCRYAHGFAELRLKPKPHWKFKTERCKKFLSGYCPYGSRCCFVHRLDEFQKPVGRGARGGAHYAQKMAMTRRWHGQWNPRQIRKVQE